MIQGPPGAPARQFPRQLHTLRFSTAQRRRGLPKLDVAEPHVLQRAELGGDWRNVLEQRQRLIDGEVEHLGDRLATVVNFQSFPAVPATLALLARYVDVWQEVHLDRDDAVALAGLAASTLDVKGEPSRS